MRIKKRIAVPSISLLAILFISFLFNINNFSIKESSMHNVSYDMASGSHSEIAVTEEAKLDINFGHNAPEHSKIITNVYISLETTEFSSTIDSLNKIINNHNGYIENSSISQNNYMQNKVLKHAQYTIRIPKEKVDKLVNEIDFIGNIISQNTSKQDITKQYYDTESRLNILKIKEERILALLQKADKIEDIITIENQLSDIIYQKESLTKNILDMDDKVSYSTVSVNISEVEKLTNGITTETSFSSKIKNAINDSLYFFKIAIEKFIITFIYALPYLLVISVISILVYQYIKNKKD